jgi:hypothetical protein
MWTSNHLVSMFCAHGYGEFGNCLTLKYIVLCHYLWRWLLTSNSKVWTKKLCLLTIDNTDYFGRDYMTCYSSCAKGFTFLECCCWKAEMVKHGRTMCIIVPCLLPNVDGQIDLSLTMVHVSLWCVLYGPSLGVAIMLICDNCSWGWHMGCFMPPLEEMLIDKWFYILVHPIDLGF